MQALEFEPALGHDEIAINDLIGQYPYRSPTVFNFFKVKNQEERDAEGKI